MGGRVTLRAWCAGAALAALATLLATAAVPLDALAAPVASRGSTGSELDAYRSFVRSPEGGRLLDVARRAVRQYWEPNASGRDTTVIRWPAAPIGIYVSLIDGHGTRACVGSVAAYRGGLAETVRDLALEALRSDPRRAPIRREELPRLRLVIAFAGTGEAVTDPMTVDPGREGLLVSAGGSSIAFLPGEARTVSWALREARRVGVLRGAIESAVYHRFPVIILAEPPPAPSHEEDSDELP